MERYFVLVASLMLSALAASCEILDDDIDRHTSAIELRDMARMFSEIPIGLSHVKEVHSAVLNSSSNGYDEEYTMRHLFLSPGSGVGTQLEDSIQTRVGTGGNDLRDLIENYARGLMTKSSDATFSLRMDPETFLNELQNSDIQIYWPYSDRWDGETMPIITFDPEDDSSVVNEGYRLDLDESGRMIVEYVGEVDEQMAKDGNVWVLNRNNDAGVLSLEMLRRMDPDWGNPGGGSIVVRPQEVGTKADESLKSLLLKEFTMKRNYDPWFAGASEFFVKVGYVKNFTASTEAELRLYNPTVTDFMIVVKRSQLGIPQPFNAMLISDWSEQMTQCAFMIIEDDGGTMTEWKTTALVRVASKSYGVEISIPVNSRDDNVWRGQLSSAWLDANSNATAHFGDVDLVFEVVEY